MRELVKEFRETGWTHRQITYSDKAYLYQKWHDDAPEDIVYEVFKRRIGTPRGFTAHLDPWVKYPTCLAFGVWAWTYTNIDSAVNKYIEINEEEVSNQVVSNSSVTLNESND